MQALLLRLVDASGPAADWILIFLATIVAIFVLYVGIAMRAVLRAPDQNQRQVRYQVFRDLLDFVRDLFRGGGTTMSVPGKRPPGRRGRSPLCPPELARRILTPQQGPRPEPPENRRPPQRRGRTNAFEVGTVEQVACRWGTEQAIYAGHHRGTGYSLTPRCGRLMRQVTVAAKENGRCCAALPVSLSPANNKARPAYPRWPGW